MKTYSQADWIASLEAWGDGMFSDEWRTIRHVMAMQGCIFPPSGDAFDSWDDAQPSQRAVLVRAMRETPDLLRRCTRNAKTWSQVIDRLFAARDEWRENLDRDDRARDDEAMFDPQIRRGAMMSVGQVFRRMGDSV